MKVINYYESKVLTVHVIRRLLFDYQYIGANIPRLERIKPYS